MVGAYYPDEPRYRVRHPGEMTMNIQPSTEVVETVMGDREPSLMEAVAMLDKQAYAIAQSMGLDIPVDALIEKSNEQICWKLGQAVAGLMRLRMVLTEIGNEVQRINHTIEG